MIFYQSFLRVLSLNFSNIQSVTVTSGLRGGDLDWKEEEEIGRLTIKAISENIQILKKTSSVFFMALLFTFGSSVFFMALLFILAFCFLHGSCVHVLQMYTFQSF
jgi:hypothetical protein